MKNFINIIFILSVIIMFIERFYFNDSFIFGFALGGAMGAYRYMNYYSENLEAATEEYKKSAVRLRDMYNESQMRKK